MEKKIITDEELRKALFEFHDIMERLTCPFFPLKSITKQIREDSLLVSDKLYVGVKSSEWTDQRQRTFDSIMGRMRIPYKETDSGYEFELSNVPVDFRIIHKDYKFLNNPEIRFFGVYEFLLPNPLDIYLKSQHLVK